MSGHRFLVSMFPVDGPELLQLGPAVASELAELSCGRVLERWLWRVDKRCRRAMRKTNRLGFAPGVRIGVWGDELRTVLEFAKRHGLHWLTLRLVDHVRPIQRSTDRYV